MNYAPIAADLALRLTRAQVNSARPGAPVIPDPEPRPGRRVRAHLASGLRRMAQVLEPVERPIRTELRT
jgi:hypothetical protein